MVPRLPETLAEVRHIRDVMQRAMRGGPVYKRSSYNDEARANGESSGNDTGTGSHFATSPRSLATGLPMAHHDVMMTQLQDRARGSS